MAQTPQNTEPDTQPPSKHRLFDFTTADNTNEWIIVNDGVMGGLSQSRFNLSNHNTAVFSGHVTTENNGGFASTRSKPKELKLKDCKGVRLRVKGDGKTYQFRMRTGNNFDGIAYRHYVETTPGEWITIVVPFDQCIPVFRGRIVKDAPKLKGENVQQFAFMIADGQTGDFQLEVAWIDGVE
jgi:monofunctional biosynthetic peptidoglycan transglycosylase